MTEQKTPKPGEWWFRHDIRVLVREPTHTGRSVTETIDGWTHHGWDFTNWHHEPHCDSFDWQEPPAETVRTIDVNPGGGYRWLEDDEIITPTDEVFRPDLLLPCWVKPLTGVGSAVSESEGWPVRRSIARTQPVETPAIDPGEGYELLPQCEMLQKGDQYFHDGKWKSSGILGCQYGHYDYRRKIKPPAESRDGDCIHDMPLNPVPGKVVATGTVKLTPVESPDDWVEITDPEHVLRSGIDIKKSPTMRVHCRRKDLPLAVPVYVTACETCGIGHHLPSGKCDHCNSERKDNKLETRVRESLMYAIHGSEPPRIPDNRPARDVIMDIVQWLDPHPPAQPKPQEALDCAEQWLVDNPVKTTVKRVPVRLWINEEDGWLFANPDQVLASDQEILHDDDGFYVEVTE